MPSEIAIKFSGLMVCAVARGGGAWAQSTLPAQAQALLSQCLVFNAGAFLV